MLISRSRVRSRFCSDNFFCHPIKNYKALSFVCFCCVMSNDVMMSHWYKIHVMYLTSAFIVFKICIFSCNSHEEIVIDLMFLKKPAVITNVQLHI